MLIADLRLPPEVAVFSLFCAHIRAISRENVNITSGFGEGEIFIFDGATSTNYYHIIFALRQLLQIFRYIHNL